MDVAAALSTITALGELTKLIIDGKVDAKVKAKAAELNNSILSLQSTLFTLQSQNHELLQEKHGLERKLVEMADWDKEASRYKLHELGPGVVVYALKEHKESPEPFHYICPNCYQEKRKSFLKAGEKSFSGQPYICSNPACEAVFYDFQDRATW